MYVHILLYNSVPSGFLHFEGSREPGSRFRDMEGGTCKERAVPVDATDAADAEASERATQLHGQDALWLSGAARQARAAAHAHHVAAGRASGAKRKANAMTPEERLEKRAADKRQRLAEKKAAQAAAAAGDAEAVVAIEAAEREADEALAQELEEEQRGAGRVVADVVALGAVGVQIEADPRLGLFGDPLHRGAVARLRRRGRRRRQ